MMSLWSIAGSPLLAGTDIIHASSQTLQILANAEVTAVNQDLGFKGHIQGTIIGALPRTPAAAMVPVPEGALVEWESTQSEVWGKRLADGHSAAVVLLNLDDTRSMNVSASISAMGLSGPVAVRDLWA